MSELSEIRVNLAFRDRQLAEFLAIKEHLGIQTNADVVRYLVRRHARALERREELLTQRRKGAEGQTKDERRKTKDGSPAKTGSRCRAGEAQGGERELTQGRGGAEAQRENGELTQRRGDAEARREGRELTQERVRPWPAAEVWRGAALEGVGRVGRPPPAQEEDVRVRPGELGHLCLDCPLPECDEGDPRCLYQRATGERERQRSRTRAYMRRVRAK